MISIIITSYKEQETIVRAIEAIEQQNLPKHELIVVAPDDETLEATWKLKKKFPAIKTFKDSGKGKPAALNLAVEKAKGNILILTDGDVYAGTHAIERLLKEFLNSHVGAVSGKPVSVNKKNTMFGYWAYLLTEIADARRKTALQIKRRFFCSGYLFAIKKTLFPKLPENLLSEDGFISHMVYQKKFRIAYAPNAVVYVKYPTTFADWIRQKKRSAGGYNQIKTLIGVNIRSFKSESLGAFGLLRYISSLRELWWLFCLFAGRIYLWVVIYRDVNLKKKNHTEIWKRVESTK